MTLLFQIKVPKQFWADEISTTCFLINRMPSTVLVGNVPYNILFQNKSLLPVEPKVFGSSCYVRDVRPLVTKLDPKSLRCVFLGYSYLQKGYVVTLLNLENIRSQLMYFFRRLHHSSMHLPFLRVRGRKMSG